MINHDTNNETLLSIKNISIDFAGIKALDEVSLQVKHGEIHALLGENGAGKSTLIKVLTGVYAKNSGQIYLNGDEITPQDVGDAQKSGISTVFQEVNLVPTMTVTENLTLLTQDRKFGFINWKHENLKAVEMLKRVGLDIDPTHLLSRYSVAIQQMIAIARALAFETKLLILDEPTASLDKEEIARLFKLMLQLKKQGIGIIFVTHFLDQVYEVTDKISVLRNGCHVGSFDTADLPRGDLIKCMVGHAISQNADKKVVNSDLPEYIRIEGLSRKSATLPVSFDIRRGEVVTLAGLLGSGRTELAELVFGAVAYDSGNISVNKSIKKIHTPKQAIELDFGFCPEDRKKSGIISELSVRENIIIALQSRKGWLRKIPFQQQKVFADEMVKKLRIATTDIEKPVGLLSGGNQQKVILARWLITNPDLLILDEPTRGIDVGAHHEIIQLIRKLCEDGMSMLVVSSELEELVIFADKVLVMRDHKVIAELSGEQINQAAIIDEIAK